MKIENLPRAPRQSNGSASPRALNPLVFSSFDDTPDNPRRGLGYLQLSDPTRPVMLTAKLPDVTRVGDTIELFWDDDAEPVQTYDLDQATIDRGWLSFSVGVGVIKAPQGEVFYTLYDHEAENLQKSAIRTVNVNRTVPGGLDPDTDTTINENLAPPTVSPSPINSSDTQVTVTVLPWEHIELGDVWTVYWNGIPVVAAPVTFPSIEKVLGRALKRGALRKLFSHPLGTLSLDGLFGHLLTSLKTLAGVGEPQTVLIPKAVLEAGGSSDKLMVYYEIRDTVDNYSLPSPPTYVAVNVDPNALAAPRVQEANQTTMVLDLEALGESDGHVLIPAFVGDGTSYTVTLEWVGKTPTTIIELTLLPIRVIDPGFDRATFVIPNADLKAIAGGSAVVRYSLVQTGTTKNSKTTSITLTGLPVQLAALQLAGATGDVIDLSIVTGDPVTVRAPAYTGQTAGDRILLLWAGVDANGTPVIYSEEYTVQAGGETGEVRFDVDRLHLEPLGGGTLQLSYQVVRAGGGTQISPVTTYNVTAVELVFPAPVIVQASDGVLSPMDVQAGATFQVTYTGMRTTDTIKPIWNNIASIIPWRKGEADETVESDVPATMIGAVLGKTIDVSYQVERDGKPYDSDILKLTVGLIPADKLTTPQITQATGGSLDVGALQGDANITVDAWPFIAVGQKMWMRLEGSSNLDLPDWQGYEISSPGAQATTVSKDDYLINLTDGSTLRLILEVSFDGGLTRRAFPVQSYTVIAVPDAVVPVITGVTTPEGTAVANGGFTSSTTLTLEGTAGPATQVRLYDGPAPLNPIDVNAQGRWTEQTTGLAVSSHPFTARVVGAEDVASAEWVVEVTEIPLSIDTSPLVLNGHLVRSGRIPTHPPVGTTATRVATGGTPPYRYSVSSNAVDINETTGTVISYRNRQGEVTVTDSKGQTAHYTVSVSNVLEIDGWNGQQNYSNAASNAANYGGRIPSQYEWRDFRAAYGGDPQFPPGANEHAWSSTSAGGNSYYTIIPNNGAESTQVSYRLAKGWAIVVRS